MELREILDCAQTIVENAVKEGPADRVKSYLALVTLGKEVLKLGYGYEPEVQDLMRNAKKLKNVKAGNKDISADMKCCVDIIETMRDLDCFGKPIPPKRIS
ncbi:MAG: hypothetical protein NC238_10330 [Dehalobacter sp.]|nr:hypothetical protein [Dehalobacter sp.]